MESSQIAAPLLEVEVAKAATVRTFKVVVVERTNHNQTILTIGGK